MARQTLPVRKEGSWACSFCGQVCVLALVGQDYALMHNQPVCRYFEDMTPETFVTASVAALRN